MSPPDPKLAAFLLGALGLLTALLTAFGTANNGVGRMELNERWPLFIGTALVLSALALGGIWLAVQGAARKWLKVLPAAGVAALTVGLVVTAWAAVTHVSGRPEITARLEESKSFGALVAGEVAVSDIPSSTHLELRVIGFVRATGRREAPRLVPIPVYAGAFGPNSSGDVRQTYEAVLPKGTRQVLVKAWTGSPGNCYDERILGANAKGKIPHNLGCVRIRIAAGQK
jgi:hypothetical protein